MTPEYFARVRNMFERALEQSPEARAAFLENACGGDQQLVEEVQRMLAADAAETSLVDQPIHSQPDPFDLASFEGRRIGAYLIQRQIGRGGMGAVFLAERADDAFHKQVAFKVVRPYGSDEIRRRFHQERQILAALDHPNIARLLDGGTTPEGLPYFVMEYVVGVPIDQYCDAHKLNVTRRLELFRIVCGIVHYAHQNLVIHRDLKPGNILVTADGTVKLLDFGIAKLMQTHDRDATVFATQKGLQLLTPEYASPEQVRDDSITTATDVYSLGVVLYELLTGHRPYRLKSRLLHEVVRVICDEDPTHPSTVIAETEERSIGEKATAITPELVSAVREGKPSRLKRRLMGDVDNILLKALRKDPAHRYSSVEQFSEDVRRHVEGFPVLAQGDSLRYRTLKFVGRNKGGVLAAATVMLVLCGGIAATTWQARVANRERDQAQRRVEQIRALARSLLFEIDAEASRIPGSLRVRSMLITAAGDALRSLAGGSEAPVAEQLEDVSRLSTKAGNTSGKLPGGWFASGLNPSSYEMGVDRMVHHSGKASGYIVGRKNSVRPGDWATLTQQIIPDEYRGRRIRVSAFIRTEGVPQGAHFWTRVNTLRGLRAIDDMRNRPIKFTTDWQKCEIVLDVPLDSTNIAYGILLIGVGKAWLDDLKVEVIDLQVPVTDLLPRLKDEEGRSRTRSHPNNLGFEEL